MAGMFRLRIYYLLWLQFRALAFCLGGLVIGYGLAPAFQINGHEDKFLFSALCAAPSLLIAMMLTGRDLAKVINEELQAQDDEWTRLVNAGLDNHDGKSDSK